MNNLANNAKTESHQNIWLNSIFKIVLNGMKHQFLFVAKENLFMYVKSLVQMVKARESFIRIYNFKLKYHVKKTSFLTRASKPKHHSNYILKF